MNAGDYKRGAHIKVRAVRPGDLVWVGKQVLRVVSNCATANEWHKLTFENNLLQYSAGGSVLVARAERVDPKPRSVDISELLDKLAARDLEVMELEEQLRHQADASLMLRYKKRAEDYVVQVIDAEAKVRDLDQQVRAQDKVIAGMREHIRELRLALDTIEQTVTSTRR